MPLAGLAGTGPLQRQRQRHPRKGRRHTDSAASQAAAVRPAPAEETAGRRETRPTQPCGAQQHQAATAADHPRRSAVYGRGGIRQLVAGVWRRGRRPLLHGPVHRLHENEAAARQGRPALQRQRRRRDQRRRVPLHHLFRRHGDGGRLVLRVRHQHLGATALRGRDRPAGDVCLRHRPRPHHGPRLRLLLQRQLHRL